MKPIDLSEYIQLEGPLFEDVQRSGIFADSKTFVDCIPKIDPQKIISKYNKLKSSRDFDLKAFVESHFILPKNTTESAGSAGETMVAHIKTLYDYHWQTRKRTSEPNG
jgi:alpha,alpha-trehalase